MFVDDLICCSGLNPTRVYSSRWKVHLVCSTMVQTIIFKVKMVGASPIHTSVTYTVFEIFIKWCKWLGNETYNTLCQETHKTIQDLNSSWDSLRCDEYTSIPILVTCSCWHSLQMFHLGRLIKVIGVGSASVSGWAEKFSSILAAPPLEDTQGT